MLRQARTDPLALPLALNIAALILFLLGAALTLVSVSNAGQQRTATLLSGPAGLDFFGQPFVAAVVLLTTVAIPLGRVLCSLMVLLGLHLPRPPHELRAIYAWAERLRPWSMVEIYLLGLFVAYVKLRSMVHIDLGAALYALAGLMLAMVAADVATDDQAVWDAIDTRLARPNRQVRAAQLSGGQPSRIGCHVCGLVSRARSGAVCPRCGCTLRHRRTDSLARSWAFSVAALLLYIPANAFPVLTVTRLGAGQPSTILGGVHELLIAGMWPLAALVFVASVVVPIAKLIGLGLLLVTTHRKSRWRLKERTVLHRVITAIGRWSMIDIFMVSILVALVQFGAIASVTPGTGATAFAAVVILTMFAAESFDPRLMWDAAAEPRSR